MVRNLVILLAFRPSTLPVSLAAPDDFRKRPSASSTCRLAGFSVHAGLLLEIPAISLLRTTRTAPWNYLCVPEWPDFSVVWKKKTPLLRFLEYPLLKRLSWISKRSLPQSRAHLNPSTEPLSSVCEGYHFLLRREGTPQRMVRRSNIYQMNRF